MSFLFIFLNEIDNVFINGVNESRCRMTWNFKIINASAYVSMSKGHKLLHVISAFVISTSCMRDERK